MKSLNKLKLPRNEGKVLKFLQDSDYYFDQALDYLDAEEFLPALDYIRRAIALDPNELDFRFLLAQVYADMGLYRKSNFEYFKLLSVDETFGECYLRISQNYFMLKEEAVAVNFLKKSIEFDFDEDEILDADELMRELSGEDFKLLSQSSEDEMLILYVRKLLTLNEHEGALQLIKYIKSNSQYYLEALNITAFCYLRLKKYEKELETAQKMLKIEQNNINALCYLSDAYFKIGNIQKAKEIADKIIDLDIGNNENYFKVSMILLQCEYMEKAIKLLNSHLSYYPYDESALLLLSLAYYNYGEIELAKDYIYKLIRIDNSNTIAKYYNQFFKQNNTSQIKLSYIQQVPQEEVEKRLLMFEQVSSYSASETVKFIKSNPDFYDYVKWLFDFGEIKLYKTMISKLAHLNLASAHQFLKYCLVDESLPYFIKQQILKEIVIMMPSHKIALLHEDQIKFLSPRVNKLIFEFPKVYFEAFVDVYCSLAFIDNDFETAFNRSVKKILNLISQKKVQFRSKHNISALFAYNFKRPEMFEELNAVVKIFGADIKTLKKYFNELGLEI